METQRASTPLDGPVAKTLPETPVIQVTAATTGRKMHAEKEKTATADKVDGVFQAEKGGKVEEAKIDAPSLAGKLTPKPAFCPKVRDLSQAIDKMNLAKISRGIQETAKLQPYKLVGLDSSANPVTKLEPAFHLPVEVAESACNTTLDVSNKQVFDAFQSAIHATSAKINSDPKIVKKEEAKKHTMGAAVQAFKSISKGNLDSSGFDELKRIIQKKCDEAKGDPAMEMLWNEVKERVSSLDSRVRLESVPIHHDKEAVLGRLRTLQEREGKNVKNMDLKTASTLLPLGGKFRVAKRGIDDAKAQDIIAQGRKNASSNLQMPISAREKADVNAPRFLQAIRQVQAIKGGYVNVQVIDSLDIDATSKAWLKKELKGYYSATDIIAHNQNRAQIMTSLKEAANLNAEFHPSYAFKTGSENFHESLGGKLATEAGMSEFLVPKTDAELKSTTLGQTENPQGLASRWLPGESFPLKLWNEWLDVKHELQRAKAEGKDTSEIQGRYDNKRQEVLQFGATKSIAKQIFFDASFMASDSHINQYKKGSDGQMHNFDFARFFASSLVYAKGGSHFANFRSDLLDHPLAEEPLSASSPYREDLSAVRQQVLAMNVDEIANSWNAKGLVGTPEFFSHHGQVMQSCEQDYAVVTDAQTSKEKLTELARSYNIPVKDTATVDEMRQAIVGKIKHKFGESQKACWSLVHPDAINQWKTGMLCMQEYYKTTPEPTLKGAVHAFFADLAPFMQAMEVLARNPGTALMIQTTNAKEIRAAEFAKAASRAPLRDERAPRMRTDSQAAALQSGLEKFREAMGRTKLYVKGAGESVRPMHPDTLPEFILAEQHYYGLPAFEMRSIWASNKQATDSFPTWVKKIENGEQVPGLDELKAKGLVDANGKIAISKVTYMDRETREATRMTIENGQFLHPNNVKPNTEANQRHIYVLGNDGTFYSAVYEQGKVNHSSFFRGQPVQGAGEFIFRNGVLAQITSKSGHYKPDNFMILNSLEALHARGVDLSRVQFYNVAEQKNYPSALAVMKQLQAEVNKPVKKLHSLQSIIDESKKSGIIPEAQVKAMEQKLAKLQASPSYLQARTGSPGI